MSVLLSPCCAAAVRVESEMTSLIPMLASRWYVCSICGKPCDPVPSAPVRDDGEGKA